MKPQKIIFLFSFLMFSIILCNAQESEEHYREAVKFYLWGDFKQSLSELNKVLEIVPGFGKAYRLKEVILMDGQGSLTVIDTGELSVEVGEVTIPIESLARRLLALESSAEYTLGADDVLEISVWGCEELTKEVIVRPDGRISFLLVGDVPARGLTPTLLAEVIAEKLTPYVKKPKVTVIVKKVGTARKEVFVLGEVKSQGGQEITEGMGVLEILSRVGGFTENAVSSSVKILRGGANPLAGEISIRSGQVISVNLDDVIIKGDLSQNVMLQPRDIVYVPKATRPKGVFILGEISKPGMYKLEEAPNLLELVTIAGGFTKEATLSSTKVIRGEPGKPIVLSSNLNKVISRADMSENLVLQSGDIVYVPRFFLANLNYFISQILPSIQFVYYTYYLTKGIMGIP
ncbi:hypothetical protein COS91_03220 [Candidatus Desantisbacteria bacterium CG07_land_8_20_14_0_80_39_15]|uniref:Soluble ligand binding domain-containing protein n=1 Tax=Candidatus Desantisbacteria bacterium CG07_land_8_20_14_0_80_39_15 TaxID=1974549 RepID=A0A2M6ZH18_9BACT|nr:MAG: hypothetical protein COS91_03220 [Candidatus Desantisbacteria bacterium CG07_land_8_20_14_0_80_39_15]